MEQLLAKCRHEAGYTQRVLAKKLKVSPGTVAKAESGAKGVDVIEFVEWVKVCGGHPPDAINELL